MLLLSHAQLLLQRLGHLGGRGAGQAEGNLQHNVKRGAKTIITVSLP